jgi:hypothetical protein
MQKELTMTYDAYNENPALRPTVLVHEVLKNVYRPTPRSMPSARPDATDERLARETPRAA